MILAISVIIELDIEDMIKIKNNKLVIQGKDRAIYPLSFLHSFLVRSSMSRIFFGALEVISIPMRIAL